MAKFDTQLIARYLLNNNHQTHIAHRRPYAAPMDDCNCLLTAIYFTKSERMVDYVNNNSNA